MQDNGPKTIGEVREEAAKVCICQFSYLEDVLWCDIKIKTLDSASSFTIFLSGLRSDIAKSDAVIQYEYVWANDDEREYDGISWHSWSGRT